MKVLVSWLRELVDVPVGIEALAERLHLAGFELASITPLDPVPGPDGPTTGPDAVIDFEITANRPDALSVAGFAREVAALYDVPLRFRPAAPPSGAHPSAVGPLRVTIEDAGAVPAVHRRPRRRDGRAVAGLAGRPPHRVRRPQPSTTSSTSPTTSCSRPATRSTPTIWRGWPRASCARAGPRRASR